MELAAAAGWGLCLSGGWVTFWVKIAFYNSLPATTKHAFDGGQLPRCTSNICLPTQPQFSIVRGLLYPAQPGAAGAAIEAKLQQQAVGSGTGHSSHVERRGQVFRAGGGRRIEMRSLW